MTQLLARQEEHTGPTRIDREDPLIETARGPTLGERGAYRWLVRFQLPFAAESDGWLIQELYQDSHSGTLDHFWECWRIRRNARYPEDPTLERQRSLSGFEPMRVCLARPGPREQNGS